MGACYRRHGLLKTVVGHSGCVSAPHHLATKAGIDILDDGGTAIEAMVAAAATIAVVYPHMNSIGGDGFWIIKKKNQAPIAIEACGQAAGLATPAWYAERGYNSQLPTRGGPAALTVPGTIGGWQQALSIRSNQNCMPLSALLRSAITHAKNGVPVTQNQTDCIDKKSDGLRDVAGFSDIFLTGGKTPKPGSVLKQEALAATFEQLDRAGLDDYYHGDIAATHDQFWTQNDSPLRRSDLADYRTVQTQPLELTTSLGTFYNTNPPTQGVASLMVLGIFDRLSIRSDDPFDYVHGLVEATKQALIVRNAELGDPSSMRMQPSDMLNEETLDTLAARIDMKRALPWPHIAKAGDTIWMGACDAEGTMVSFIQSVFWEFGSGLTCPETGVFFQNRGAGFSMQPGPNQLAPGKKPFHTLNPAMGELRDGRLIAYGTMGGEGQPQTQAALLTRYAGYGIDLQEAISMPRWLLGKTWGQDTTSLKLESGFDETLVQALKLAGHFVEIVPSLNDLMGHAGAVVLHPGRKVSGATDPRSDGLAQVTQSFDG